MALINSPPSQSFIPLDFLSPFIWFLFVFYFLVHTLSKDTPYPSMKCFNGVKYNKIEAFSLILLEKTTCTNINTV